MIANMIALLTMIAVWCGEVPHQILTKDAAISVNINKQSINSCREQFIKCLNQETKIEKFDDVILCASKAKI